MKDEIVFLSLFSGIEGFVKGFEEAGFKIKKHYFSEVDKHAIAVTKYNYKNSEYAGSVTDVRGNGIEHPDIITFGSPCQDFSISGKKLGMEGQRSVLILEAIRIIRECRPSVFIWENVKGAYSSNDGADFWAIIAAFTNIGGYRLEWQLLNTSWFLPQNRERIYLVGHLTGCGGPRVFPIGEKFTRINEGLSETSNVRTITAGGNSGGHHSGMTLIQSFGRNEKQKIREKENPKNANCLTQRYGKDGKENLIITDHSYKNRAERNYTNNSPTIKENSGRTVKVNNIRRLTEIECERLQGFPDDWTKYGDYNGVIKEVPKTQRYKLCGNAVSVPVVKAIAQRLKLNK